MKKVLLTTTSYQDTPGDHHALLESQDFEITRERGPLPESRMLELAGEFDGILCGDDEITAAVIDKALPTLKVISKYGIGLDKIDVDYATEKKIPILFTPGVNHTTVAEHAFGLLLAFTKHLVDEVNHTRKGEWTRITGNEIWNKRMGIIGLGRIGKEVVIRAKAFGMHVHGNNRTWPEEFASEHEITRHETPDGVFENADVLSLHTSLNENTRHLVNAERVAKMPKGAIIINTARGELVDADAVLASLDAGHLGGYVTDVLEVEPPDADEPLLRHPKVLVSPHIGSRTYESVPRQAMMATKNLVRFLKGEAPLAQANKV